MCASSTGSAETADDPIGALRSAHAVATSSDRSDVAAKLCLTPYMNPPCHQYWGGRDPAYVAVIRSYPAVEQRLQFPHDGISGVMID